MNSIKQNIKVFTVLLLAGLLLKGCGEAAGCEFVIGPGPDAQAETQDALLGINQGECIEFERGTYEFDRTLTMDDKSNVRLKGKGRVNTIFSFAGQISGGDGLLITNSRDIVIRDFTIRDAVGDALKIRESRGIVLSGIGAVWSGEPSEENGAYGLYPVLSSDILIEDSYAFGASDAGIYVGQSDRAIVRNSEVEGNVAGIEIENTTNADVYGNTVHDNAAGILVFDLPGLSQSGARTRIFNNTVTGNNRGNFAPTGAIVAEVAAGTGILVVSVDSVEVFNNSVEENNVVGIGINSYLGLVSLGLGKAPPEEYDPYPEQIFVHDNSFSRSNTYPPAEEQSTYGNLLVKSFGSKPIPDYIIDGIFAPGSGESGTICLEDNTGGSFVNLNLQNDFPNNLSFDSSPHNCSFGPLPEVKVDVPEY